MADMRISQNLSQLLMFSKVMGDSIIFSWTLAKMLIFQCI